MALALTVFGANAAAAASIEDFETGDFNSFPWSPSGAANWVITSLDKHSGAYSARAGTIGDLQSSSLQVTLTCVDGAISFWRKVSSEGGFDFLGFYIDGVEQQSWSGSLAWGQVSFPVTAGNRTFMWTYAKDFYDLAGSDTAWIDDIQFPLPAPPTVSTVSVVSGLQVDVTFSKVMGAGVTTAANYALSGAGKGTLATNPTSVALQSGNTYRLTWADGEMFIGGDITITVTNIQDAGGTPIGSPNSGTHRRRHRRPARGGDDYPLDNRPRGDHECRLCHCLRRGSAKL